MQYLHYSSLIIYLLWGLVTFIFASSAIISYYENEKRAGHRLLILSLILAFLTFYLARNDYNAKPYIALFTIVISIVALYLFLKKPIQPKGKVISKPIRNVDEHNVIFARIRLQPNTPEWDQYYSAHPIEAQQDAKARSLPGLLSSGSSYYNPLTFSSANSSFSVIDYLHSVIPHPKSSKSHDFEPEKLTSYIKNWAKHLGVHSIGIAELKDYHLYTVRGRGENRGKPVEKKHPLAIAFTVEMDYRNVQSAPASSVVLESSQQYLKSATIALQLANMLKGLGFDSRAHIDGDYELICPLVARDAGLGEIGRMGLLMTPKLGPRARIAVVTTNAPLANDSYIQDPTVVEFCRFCKKCADCCPGRSIPVGDMQAIDGVSRWQIDADSCYQYWCTTGTDCGRCISVCPFSHPNNVMHNVVRRLIRRSNTMARLAYVADDWLYGRKPQPKPLPKWMQI